MPVRRRIRGRWTLSNWCEWYFRAVNVKIHTRDSSESWETPDTSPGRARGANTLDSSVYEHAESEEGEDWQYSGARSSKDIGEATTATSFPNCWIWDDIVTMFSGVNNLCGGMDHIRLYTERYLKQFSDKTKICSCRVKSYSRISPQILAAAQI